jgi:hypothetical protein
MHHNDARQAARRRKEKPTKALNGDFDGTNALQYYLGIAGFQSIQFSSSSATSGGKIDRYVIIKFDHGHKRNPAPRGHL